MYKSPLKQTLGNAVISSIIRRQKDQLSDKDQIYVIQSINRLPDAFIIENDAQKVAKVLSDMIYSELNKQREQLIKQRIDIHELMKQQITDQPDTTSNDIPTSSDELKNIFAIPQPTQLQNIINPKALETKAYVVLDRRYLASSNNIQFKWDITYQTSVSTGYNALGISAILQDITKIKIFPFVFPNTLHAVTGAKKLSLLFSEFETQAYMAVQNAKRFHVMFGISTPLAGEQHNLSNAIGENEFEFNRPIIQISSLTLSFGNPLTTLELDPDKMSVDISSSGALALLTFATSPRIISGDIVIISGFSTTDPTADAAIISAINDSNGYPVSIVTPTTMTIPVDLTALVGVIINPSQAYLDSKRFIIPVEFTFRRTVPKEYGNSNAGPSIWP